MVVGIAGEGEWIEPEGVDRRKLKQSKVRVCGLQIGQIEVDDVVAQKEVRAVGEVVEIVQRPGEAATSAGKGQRSACIRPNSPECVDALVSGADFEVQGETAEQWTGAAVACSDGKVPSLSRRRTSDAPSSSLI